MLHGLTNILSATEEPTGIAALGLDPWAIIAQAATFLILFLVIKKFALGKISKTLEERRKTIDRGLHLTAELDQQKVDLDAKIEASLKKARVQADTIINEAHTESGAIIKAAEDAAGRKADAILQEAEAKIHRDIEQARDGLKAEVAEMVVAVSENVLREKVTPGKDRELVEKYVKEALK